MPPVHVIGGGLAGSEAAWQLAERGHDVVIHEMRPEQATPAHKTDKLAELVCSNTFKSTETTNAHGLLKAEMRLLGSVVLAAADEARVPGGSALTEKERMPAISGSDASGASPEGAYLNCPFTREQYENFLDALIAADQHHG